MAEVTDSGEDHSKAKAIGCGNDVLVSYRAPGLDDCGCAGGGYSFEAVGEWEVGV